MVDSENGVDSKTESVSFLNRFNLSLEEGYQVALNVFKLGKDGGKFSYEEKIKLAALWRQSTHGPFSADKFGEIGFFDFVGNDRRKAWQALGDMEKEEAKREFCQELSAVRQEEMEQVADKVREAKQLAKEAREREEAERKLAEEAERKAREEAERQAREAAERKLKEEQERREREAAQHQAAAMAQRQDQLADRDRQQRELIEAQRQQLQSSQQYQQHSDVEQNSQDTRHGAEQVDGAMKIAPPEVWSRPERADFIAQMKQDPEAVIVLGHGETVTVKAVTNPAGSRMFWEFATENYDLAFGVSFQWPAENSTEGPIVEILPSERRPSHQVVIGGSHDYPGSGTYLIQFDNTYSVLRAKTVYYRVYYAA